MLFLTPEPQCPKKNARSQSEGEGWGSCQEPVGPVAGNLKNWRRESQNPALLSVLFASPCLLFWAQGHLSCHPFSSPFPASGLEGRVGTHCCKTSQGLCLLSWDFPAVLQINVEFSLSNKTKPIIKIPVNRSHSIALKYTTASPACKSGSGGGRSGSYICYYKLKLCELCI